MKRMLFIDRDGTLIREPEDQQIDSLEKLEFLPYVFRSLGRIQRELDYELVIVTNQDGLGTDSFPEDDFWPAQNKMIQAFKNEGISFTDIHIDRTLPKDNAPTRKPGTQMLTRYIQGEEYDLQNSFVIGDRITDLELAKNLGASGILLGEQPLSELQSAGVQSSCALIANDWLEICELLLQLPRNSRVTRETKETKINISLNLEGSGNSKIETGNGFFDHMLEQIARHSECDLEILTRGDTEVDEHHTIEDTALALGAAFKQALGKKVGIERYGFCLPMDDCLAQVAIDFGGRSWIEWDAEFNREKIGEMPTEMFFHFFKSFADAAACNINIRAEGKNEHHKIEAIFKAFARAIKMAKRKDINSSTLPSTKGVL